MTKDCRLSIYIAVCFLLLGCKSEPSSTPTKIYEEPYGSWVLVEAKKNDKETKTLEGTIFVIDSTVLSTNLFGEKQEFAYQLAGNTIELLSGNDQKFVIENLTTDSLFLNMRRRNKNYELIMVRDTTTEN